MKNTDTAIATPEQIADKITFHAHLDQWDKSTIRNCARVDFRLNAGVTHLGDGLAISSAHLDLTMISDQHDIQPVRSGTIFKITIERVS